MHDHEIGKEISVLLSIIKYLFILFLDVTPHVLNLDLWWVLTHLINHNFLYILYLQQGQLTLTFISKNHLAIQVNLISIHQPYNNICGLHVNQTFSCFVK
jgi:hypothetical protein